MGKAKRPGRIQAGKGRTAPARPSSRMGGVTAEGWAEAVLWLLILLPPLLPPAFAKEAFRLPKLMLSEWLGLASLLPLAFRLRAVGEVRWRDLLAVRPLVAVAPLLAVATASLLTTRHPLQVREALADLWIGAACLLGWSAGLSRQRLLRLLTLLLVPAAALALLGILQFHGLYQPFQFEGRAQAGRLAVTSLAGNPGDLGAYLVLPCLVAQWALVRELADRRRGSALAALGAALAVCLYAMAATQTISALAAVAAGSLVLWALLAPRRFLVPAFASALGLAAALVLAVSPLRARVVEKAAELGRGDWNSVLSGRLDPWRAATLMLAEHPLTGVGQGGFQAEFVPAKLVLLDRGMTSFIGTVEASFENAHNELLDVGADLGAPGLLALGWGIWVLFGALRRLSAVRDRQEVALAWGGAAALALLSLFQFPFRVALIAFPALLFLAWVFADGRRGAREATG